MATIFDILGGGSPTSILESTANLAAEKLASGLPVSSEPPANAFNYFNLDEDVGLPATTVGNNLNKFIPQQMSSPRAMGAEEIKTLPNQGIIGLLKSGAGKVRDTFLKGIAAQGGLNIGANLGFAINPALTLPFALGGAFLGATGIREATPGERGIQQLYGGPNTIQQGATFIDPETGEEVESEMAGYNISSMFGKGLPAAIQKRMDKINKTLSRRDSAILSQRLERLEAEKAAAEAAELAAQQEATRSLAEANRQTAGTSDATGGYQSSFSQDSDFMGGGGTAAEMGSFKQGGIVGLL